MNAHEVVSRIEARIAGIEEEKLRLREGRNCLRRVGDIADRWQLLPKQEKTEIGPALEIAEPAVSEGELLEESAVETSVEEDQSISDQDPLEQLRKRISGDSEGMSEPVFGSRLLSVAGA